MSRRPLVNRSNRDYCAGALMIAIGLAAIVGGRRYPLGTLSRMGPGYFPVALGVILTLLGVGIAATARFASRGGDEKVLPPEWRGWLCVGLSIVAFVVLGRYGGFIPATFAVVFISALADRQNGLVAAIVLGLAMVLVCVVVFWWALQMTFPLFGWGTA
ncbi:MAG TPA: tripartite tricarboxylate transporter TctB family protein [Casimicrobiaceae bacterium]|nr:tripartite tricarboxylate transporter TctB family protein [Casimicrobiaceae bacterium]